MDDDRDRIDAQRAAGVRAVVVDDVAGALGHEQPVGPQATFVDLGWSHSAERADERQPGLADAAALVGQLVVAPRFEARRR